MTEVEPLRRGDVYRHEMAGGGGYGDPLEREPEAVLWDVIEEKISPAAARRDYGVVIAQGAAESRVDAEATAALRRNLREARAGA
jgi:N-methylhydantoinase B